MLPHERKPKETAMTSTKYVSLPDALAPRMAMVAEFLAERVDNPGAWKGYVAEEGLVGKLTRPSSLGGALTVEYYRAVDAAAQIDMGFLTMVDIKERHRGPRKVVESRIETGKRFVVRIPQGVKDERLFEHEFTRTTSFATAAKRAWDVAAKAALGASIVGVNASLEVSAKYGEELSQQVGGNETTRDLLSERLTFTGPLDTTLEAYRAVDHSSRTVHVLCDWDGKLYIRGGPTYRGPMEFTTFKTQFLPVARRIADSSIYGYDEFMRYPLSDDEIAALEAPNGQTVEFEVVYDDVEQPTLREVTD